jgi:hypothetical protein
LIKQGGFELPTEQEIQDRSKSNALLTAIAVAQIAWFSLDCTARATQSIQTAQSLALTKLDTVTITYIAVSLSVHIAWWDNPRNVDPGGVIFSGFLEPHALHQGISKFVDLLGVVYGAADFVFRLEDTGRFYAGTSISYRAFSWQS